jgi:branched-chain amino acid transport system permease protein
MTGRHAATLQLGVFAVLAAFPFVAGATGETFFVAFGARVLIYAIAAMALNLALGFGGMVSLGHALFLGLGMYCVALPAHLGVNNGWVHLALTVAVCASIGAVTGFVSLRTSGIAFIMITLAFAQMGYFIFVSLKQFGGDDGLAVAAPSDFSILRLDTPGAVYGAALACLVMLVVWMGRLRASPFGMSLRACRQSPRRTASLGITPRRCLLTGYVISSVVCGIAGMLLANLNAYASPSTMSWLVSGELIVMVVLGGIGTVLGPAAGAFVYLTAEELLKAATDHWMALFGLGILAMALVGRTGLAGWITRASRPRASHIASRGTDAATKTEAA